MRDKIHAIVDIIFKDDGPVEAPTPIKPGKRRLTSADIDDIKPNRDVLFFEQLDQKFERVANMNDRNRFLVRNLQKRMKWFRKQLGKLGDPWGT